MVQLYFLHHWVSYFIFDYYDNYLFIIIGLVWIAVYHDSGGTMDAWFTIFIDLDQVSNFNHLLFNKK